MPASIKVPTEFTATDRTFGPTVKRMTRDVMGFTKQTNAALLKVNNGLKNTTNKLSNLTVMGASLGLGYVLREGADAAIQYEKGLVGISKTTGITGDNLKGLSADVLEVADNLRGISPQKLLELGQVAGQSGLSNSEDILNFSSMFAQLEKASPIQGEEGAQSILRILQLTGDGVKGIKNFSDTLVALGNTSATTETRIIANAAEIARSVSAWNVSTDHVLGLSTALDVLGVAPEVAGSSMLEVFRRLEIAVAKGGKSLGEFGLVMGQTGDEIKKDFTESPIKSLLALSKGLRRVKEEGGSVSVALQKIGLSDKRVSKTLGSLAKNFELLEKKISFVDDKTKTLDATSREYNLATQTVATGIQEIGDAFDTIFIKQSQQGKKMVILRKLLFAIADNMGLIVTVAAVLIGTFLLLKAAIFATSLVLGIYNIGIGVMAAATGFATLAVRSNAIALGAYKATLYLIAAATKIFTAAQWLLNIAMDANPIGLLIIGIAALIGIIYLAIKHYDKWRTKIYALFQPMNVLGRYMQGLYEKWGAIKDAFTSDGMIAGLKAIGSVLIEAIVEPIKMALRLLAEIPGVSSFAVSALEGLGETYETSLTNGDSEVIPSPQMAALQNQSSTSTSSSDVSITLKDGANAVESVEQSGNAGIPVNVIPSY